MSLNLSQKIKRCKEFSLGYYFLRFNHIRKLRSGFVTLETI